SLLQSTYTTTIAEVIRQVITLTGGFIAISVIAPQVTLVMLLVLPVVVILGFILGKMIRRYSRKAQDLLAETNVIVEETLQAINSVKSFTGELFELSRYSKSLGKSVNFAIKSGRFRAVFFSVIIPTVFSAYVAVMWFGAKQIEDGEILPGDLISVILIMGFLGGSIFGLGELFGQIQRAIGASERILEILDEEEEDGLLEEMDQAPIAGTITFEEVGFSYPTRSDVTVLDGLQLAIGQGQRIALVGRSGEGKSTVVQVLQRLYDLQAGQIKIDGIPIDEMSLKRLRANIGIVPQEIILFGGSIRENVLYGKPSATEAEVYDALKKANALEFVEGFPDQLDTLVGERGMKLSGGQRQRIAIARAILKNPSILILDEATSSLDAESEQLVQQALDNLMVGRTTLIIAHRLTTIRAADKILILKGGKIVESGKHDELLQIPDGHYSRLVRLQTEGMDIS
ncbi:MAG: ATP-binding cassette domain-containing protein, partial [Bacteroidota bacterium]